MGRGLGRAPEIFDLATISHNHRKSQPYRRIYPHILLQSRKRHPLSSSRRGSAVSAWRDKFAGFLIPFFAILAPGSAVRRLSSRASHARRPLLRHLRAVVESLAFCWTCCWSAIDFASANDEERGHKQPDFPTGSRDRDSICAGCSFLCTRSAPA